MRVDRCVCRNVSFDEIKRDAAALGGDADTVCSRVGCGDGCSMCVPYIRRLLATGETCQSVMSASELKQWMQGPSSSRR